MHVGEISICGRAEIPIIWSIPVPSERLEGENKHKRSILGIP